MSNYDLYIKELEDLKSQLYVTWENVVFDPTADKHDVYRIWGYYTDVQRHIKSVIARHKNAEECIKALGGLK